MLPIGVQIDLFVFDALQTRCHASTLAMHIDPDTVILHQPGEFQAGKLAALVSIEDIRRAMLVYGFLHSFNAEVGG